MHVSASELQEAVLPPERLERYASAIVSSCLRLAPGDTLFVQGQPAHRELMVALAAAAYRVGARHVDVDYIDNLVNAERIRHAPEDALGARTAWWLKRARAQLLATSATVTIIGEGDPGAFDGLPPERVVADQQRPAWYLRAITGERRRWTGVAWPTEYWAGEVYPDLAPRDAQRRLASDLLWFCRLGPDDPPGAEGWEAHVDALAHRARVLTDLRLERLELRGPGTRLDLRLAPDGRWLGGREENAHGQLVASNFPTEENFTSPVPTATEGTFRCSRPLLFRGRLIEGIAGELRRGRLVRLDAANDADRDLLAAFFASDKGAARLGEVALVDRTSRIGHTERVYYNTLIDENAAAHIAFGFGFDLARRRLAGVRPTRVNYSNLHLDVMIGTEDFEATGITADGSVVPLLREGTWQIH
jgi:aminopeptidase